MKKTVTIETRLGVLTLDEKPRMAAFYNYSDWLIVEPCTVYRVTIVVKGSTFVGSGLSHACAFESAVNRAYVYADADPNFKPATIYFTNPSKERESFVKRAFNLLGKIYGRP
jgi:hypothetical protein